MVTIIKHIIIGIRPQFSKELDYLISDIGLDVINTDFYETEFMGKQLCRYYIEVRCDEKEEKCLIKRLKLFNHDVTVRY